MPRPFCLLVKPASADCNLRCDYCFYLGHSSFYPDASTHRMSAEVLEQMVRSYMHTPQPQYSFGWQGGEPTLMGLDFFERVVELQQRHGQDGAVVGNGLQTNAVLISDPMARHFARYHFLLGVSLDGPAEIHDAHRRKVTGTGSHAEVMRAVSRLREHGVDFNILVLVNAANVRRAADVYRYLVDQGLLYHQYIPCVEPGPSREVLPFSISGPEWGDFLCTLFDLWYAGDTRRVSVRLFDSVLALLVDGVRNICHLGGNCCQYYVVEYNGDVFPCDFFVEKRLQLGNVMTDTWSALEASPLYREFGSRKRLWNPACDTCRHQSICAGDCLKHRFCVEGGDPRRLSHLCAGWRQFYDHALPRFQELARQVVADRHRQEPPQSSSPAVPGRNEPCPCGSGKKYKRCCGQLT